MIGRAMRSTWLARGLMLLGVFLFIASPMTSAAAKPMPCCAEAPCHDIDKSACPDACVAACQAVVAPTHNVSEPIRRDAPRPAPEISSLPPGRAVAPDLPPPR